MINITGLGLAIGCCIPFYHIIQYETSFDHFHERADRIYRLILDWSDIMIAVMSTTPLPYKQTSLILNRSRRSMDRSQEKYLLSKLIVGQTFSWKTKYCMPISIS